MRRQTGSIVAHNVLTLRVLALIILVSSGVAAQSVQSPKDIPAIAKAANGAVVSIIMSDKDGQPIAQGSGFLISKDGRVVTNYHVVKRGSSAVIKLPDGAFFLVDGVVAFDKARDVAVIKAHGENFRTVALGDSDRLQVGEEVVAIGNPLSLESTVSNGIVSGIRTIGDDGGKFLQITTPISHGGSGGPLFNMAGEVVGITSSGLPGGENLNFAIPINDAKPLLLAKVFKVYGLPDEIEPVKARTTDRNLGTAISNTRLSETLQWLSGASDEESATGVPPYSHYTFESKAKNVCSVAITETRVEAGPDWWDKMSFSLADIDPADIQVEDLGKGEFAKVFAGESAVSFHTTDYRKAIIDSTKGPFYPGGQTLAEPSETPTSNYILITNDWFAPRFAKAFKHAVELCGGKRSSF